MGLGHETLVVYRFAIAYVSWDYKKSACLNGIHRPARDQWLRANQSFPLNVAEKSGKTLEADRRRFFNFARGSVMESAAVQDVLVVGNALEKVESRERKVEHRMGAMLNPLGGRGYCLNEGSGIYEVEDNIDSDGEESKRDDYGST